MVAVSWTDILHPKDENYIRRRSAVVDDLIAKKFSKAQLEAQLRYQASQRPSGDDLVRQREMSQKLLGELYNARWCPPAIKGLLDTTAGAALIRQDLDPVLQATYVQEFPAWARIKKVESNGLTTLAPTA